MDAIFIFDLIEIIGGGYTAASVRVPAPEVLGRHLQLRRVGPDWWAAEVSALPMRVSFMVSATKERFLTMRILQFFFWPY